MQIPTDRSGAKLFLLMVALVYALAYVGRWIYLQYYMVNGITLLDVAPDWNTIFPRALTQSLGISTIIFGLFFLSCYSLSNKPSVMRVGSFMRVGYRAPTNAETVAVVGGILATIVFRRAYGSVLGEQPADIPFGLGTPIFRAHADFVPGLLLLLAEASWFSQSPKRYKFWICALAVFNITLSVITTSKAGVINFAVELLMFMYLTGQNIFARPWRLAALAFVGLLGFIYAAQLRAQALYIGDAQIMIALKEGRVTETLLEVAGLIMNRLPGAEGLALYCGYTCEGMPTFSMPTFGGEAGQIFTSNVIGVQGDFDFRSPGVVGGAIIIAGLYGGGLLVIGFLRVVFGIIRFFDRKGVSIAAKALLCFGIFRFIIEGVWAWQDIASLTASIILIEIIARAILVDRTKTRHYGARSILTVS